MTEAVLHGLLEALRAERGRLPLVWAINLMAAPNRRACCIELSAAHGLLQLRVENGTVTFYPSICHPGMNYFNRHAIALECPDLIDQVCATVNDVVAIMKVLKY